jgi:hypothetical protein
LPKSIDVRLPGLLVLGCSLHLAGCATAKKRHRIGIEVGGSAYAQVAYRLRLSERTLIQTGGLLGPSNVVPGNVTLGGIVEIYDNAAMTTYIGAGATYAFVAGKSFRGGDRYDLWQERIFGYGRVGLALKVGDGEGLLALELGSWAGVRQDRHDYWDARPTKLAFRHSFLRPMLGLSYFW